MSKIIKVTCDVRDKLPIEQLINFQGELKTLTVASAQKLEKSIAKYGFTFPCFIWKNKGKNYIIDAHQRVAVVNKMIQDGWKIEGGKVPVVIIEAKNEKEAKEKVLLATSQYGRMNTQGLYELIETSGLDVNAILGTTDFPEVDPARFLDEFYREKGKTDPDEAPALEATSTTKVGDRYQCGDHRVMCGDSTNPKHVKALCENMKADMIFTDPPYNVDYAGRGKETSNKIKNDNMDEASFRAMLEASFHAMLEASREDVSVYICYASVTHREFEDSINKAGMRVKNQIIWVKKVASMGWGDYRWKHEPILYCVRQDKKHKFYGDRCQYTEWTEELTDEELLKKIKRMIEIDEAGGSTVWRLHRDKNYSHPTQKPIKLIEIALKNNTRRGDVVLDPFSGSGSTLIACEGLGRKCMAMELDPRYVDVIVKRWEDFTGKKAQKVK